MNIGVARARDGGGGECRIAASSSHARSYVLIDLVPRISRARARTLAGGVVSGLRVHTVASEPCVVHARRGACAHPRTSARAPRA